jgi:GT2 family glycosyltransferase
MEPVVTAATAIADEAGFGAERLAVSVIIATYRRRELLCDTLRHIQNQGYPNLEVIVVDQTEPGFGEGIDHDLLGCVQYVRAAQPNLSRARNLGLDRSHGAILLFCDDDIVPCQDWIAAHARRYCDPQVMAVAGRERVGGSSLADKSVQRARWKGLIFRLLVLGQNMKTRLTGQEVSGRVGNRIVAQFSTSGAILHDWTVEGTGDVDFAKGCNMSFRRQVFEIVGRFDPRCTGREETDLFLRMKRAGLRVLYDSSAAVVHLKSDAGGTRLSDPAAHYRWLFDYEAYFFLKNFPWLYFPLFLARLLPEIAGCGKAVGRRGAKLLWTSLRQAGAAARQARTNPGLAGTDPIGERNSLAPHTTPHP